MKAHRTWDLLRLLFTFITMFVIWLLFTASLAPFSLISGLIGSLVVAALTYDSFIAEGQANSRYFIPNVAALVLYVLFLLYQIYASSFTMLLSILGRREGTSRIVYIRTRLKSDFARTALANSITMTPGTMTLDLNEDHLIIHWFFSTTSHSKAAGEKIKGSLESFIRRVWS